MFAITAKKPGHKLREYQKEARVQDSETKSDPKYRKNPSITKTVRDTTNGSCTFTAKGTERNGSWIVDSRATSHTYSERHCFLNLDEATHEKSYSVQELIRKKLAIGGTLEDCGIRSSCECYQGAKFPRLQFPKQSKNRSKQPLDLLHVDVWSDEKCHPRRISVLPHSHRRLLPLHDGIFPKEEIRR